MSEFGLREQPFEERESSNSYTIQLNQDQMDLLGIIPRIYGFRPEDEKILSDLGWNERKATEVVRSLQGILCMGEVNRRSSPGTYYPAYFLPEVNREAVERAFDNGGRFEKEINQVDLQVLRSMLQRDSQLRQMRRNPHRAAPRFHPTEISQLSGLPPKVVRVSMERMIGLLGFVSVDTHFPVGFVDNVRHTYSGSTPNWFIPPAHRGVVEELVFSRK